MADFQIGNSFVKGRETVLRAVKLPGAERLFPTVDAFQRLTLPTLPPGERYLYLQAVTQTGNNFTDNNQQFRLLGDDGWEDSVIVGSGLQANCQAYFQKKVKNDTTSLNTGFWDGAFAGGTGYTKSGTYSNVALTSTPAAGRVGAQASITVDGGTVTGVYITNGGTGYQVGDVLTCAAGDIGGGGTGFDLTVAAPNIAPGPIFAGGYDASFQLIQQSRVNKTQEIYFEFLKELGQANDGSSQADYWVYDATCMNGVIMNYKDAINADNLSVVTFDIMSRGRVQTGLFYSKDRVTVGGLQVAA
jgi:hypothetical protein